MPLPTWHPIRLRARLLRGFMRWFERAEARAHQHPLRSRYY